MLACPFCGREETARIDVEGRRFVVFACLFTPSVDPGLDDAALDRAIRAEYAGRGPEFFRGMCDRLHVYVTKGEGARHLRGGDGASAPDEPRAGPTGP
ncbi:MAG TPA: hypothetical protein VLX64_00650 [Thermoplasmata archaeon]|nr:hypothetical protein [Thermoplasmata archaeon]